MSVAPGQFLEKLRAALERPEHDGEAIGDVFDRVARLNAEGKQRHLGALPEDQFAPVFVGRNWFDFVIGNPRGSTGRASRTPTAKELEALGNLWPVLTEGPRRALGGGKKDLAMLFTYACLDNYVKDKGPSASSSPKPCSKPKARATAFGASNSAKGRAFPGSSSGRPQRLPAVRGRDQPHRYRHLPEGKADQVSRRLSLLAQKAKATINLTTNSTRFTRTRSK